MEEGLESFMLQKIDSISELLQSSQELNYRKYGIDKQMYHENVLHSSYDQYVQDLKDFIVAHMAFLRSTFANCTSVEPSPSPSSEP